MSHSASPQGNGGRGLKHRIDQFLVMMFVHRPPATGAWIETVDLLMPYARNPRIAPRQRGAWIETAETILLNGADASHRPPATGGVD